MRALYIHISGLVALLVFLKEVLNYTPIERTILVAATTGITVYLMLIVGHTIVMRIMAYSPPQNASSSPARSTPDAAARRQAPHHPAAPEAPQAPSPAAPPAPSPGEAAANQTADSTAAGGGAEAIPDETNEAPEAPNDAPEASNSAPDRAPNTERPDADASPESLAQSTA